MKYFSRKFLLISLLSSLAACSGPRKKSETPAPADYSSFKSAVRQLNEKEIHRLGSPFLERNPNDPLVLNGLAYFYRKTGRLKMSEILTRRILKNRPEDLRAKRNLALIYLDKNRDNLALQIFLEIYKTDEGFPGVASNIAHIYRKYSMNELAEKYLKQIDHENEKQERL